MYSEAAAATASGASRRNGASFTRFSLYGTQGCHSFDLHQKISVCQSANFHAGRGWWIGLPVVFRSDGAGAQKGFDVRHEDGFLDDVSERGVKPRQYLLKVSIHEVKLCGHVRLADDLSLIVDADGARDEQQRSGAHGSGKAQLSFDALV